MNHTPGPWHVGGIFEPDSDRPSRNVWGPIEPGKQSGMIVCCNATIMDARLIAAAPELAQALRDLYTECDAMQHEELDEHPVWGPIMRAAAAALAKAGSAAQNEVAK